MTSRIKKYNQYFTPSSLADKLIGAITVPLPSHIGDFAAGDGELLRAAEKRWPKIICTAVDIDDEVIAKLRDLHPAWNTKCFDFTNAEVRKNELIRRGGVARFPAIVLNPPFSILGGETRLRTVVIANTAVRCSPALAFIIEAFEYLEKRGQLVAIVPHAVIQGEKDEIARQILIRHYGFEVVEVLSKINFNGCSPRTAIIRLTNGLSKSKSYSTNSTISIVKNKSVRVHIYRGTVSNTKVIHSEHIKSIPFIHTTDLLNSLLHKPKKHIYQEMSVSVPGPAVLIPRVGKPDVKKIVILPKGATVVVSDCIIALLCDSEEDSELMHNILIQNWPSLEIAYGGTCARFISIKTLSLFLHKLSFEVNLYKPGMSNQNKMTAIFIKNMQSSHSQINQGIPIS